MSKTTKVVIFDFDGTLADVAELIKTLYAELALQRGWPELTEEAYIRLRKGTVPQAIKWVGVRPWQLPGLLREGRAQFHARSSEVILFPGIDKVVKKLHADGWEIYVLSSNSPGTIREVLRANDLADKMHILRRPSMFGKDKSINKLIHREAYNRANVWMVGDELRDVDGANKAGVRSIAVSWGLQDISALQAAGPTAVADKPADIVTILDQGYPRSK